MLLNFHSAQDAPTTKNHLVPHVKVPKVKNPARGTKGIITRESMCVLKELTTRLKRISFIK